MKLLALLAACFFVAALVDLFGRPRYLDVELSSATPVTLQVFFDTGAGFTEAGSATGALSAGRQIVRFALPQGQVSALRIDPDNQPFDVTVHRIGLGSGVAPPPHPVQLLSNGYAPCLGAGRACLVQQGLLPAVNLDLSRLVPVRQIDFVDHDERTVRLRSTPSANDGAVSMALPHLALATEGTVRIVLLATLASALALVTFFLGLKAVTNALNAPRPVWLVTWIRANDCRGWWFAGSTIVVLAGCVYWRYLLGGDLYLFCGDIGSDTCYSYWPLTYHLAHYVRHWGWPTWSFGAGLGMYIGIYSDPFYYLAGIAGAERTADLRIVVQLTKLVLGAGFVRLFFLWSGVRPVLATVGAAVFVFCGYNNLDASWDSQGSEMVVFAFAMAALARLVARGNADMLRLAFAAAALMHALLPFQIGLLGMCFVSLRAWTDARGATWWLRMGTQVFFGWALGCMLAAVVFAPALFYMLDNPRTSGDMFLPWKLLHEGFSIAQALVLKSTLYAYYGKEILGFQGAYAGWGNYFEGPTFYVGLPALLLALQALRVCAGRRMRRAVMGLLMVCAAYALFPFLRHAVYGFGHIAFRFGALWISTALLCAAVLGVEVVLRHGVHRGLLAAGLALVCGPLLAAASGIVPGAWGPFAWLCLAALSVYGALLLTVPDGGPASRVAALAVLCVVWVAETACAGFVTQGLRVPVTRREVASGWAYFDTANSVMHALATEDKGWYRAEKGFNSVFLNDAYVQGYRGTQTYSFVGRSLTDINEFFGVRRPVAIVSYIGAAIEDPSLLSLEDVKYLLMHPDQMPPSDFVPIWQVGNVALFRNQNALALGRLMHRAVARKDVEVLPRTQRASVLASVVAVEPEELHAAGIDPAAVEIVSAATAVAAVPDRSETFDPASYTDKAMAGKLEAAAPGILALSIPYDAGWRVSVDGREQATFHVNSSFLGTRIAAPGTHRISLEFIPPYWRAGMLISLFALAVNVWLAYAFWRRRRIDTAAAAALVD